MRRTTLFTAVALVAALAAACGEDPKPRFSPSESPATSVSPTSSATPQARPPVMPEVAKKHTKAGAEAFARYLVATVNYATSTFDTSPLASIVNPGCDTCQNAIAGYKVLKNRGAHNSGGLWIAPNIETTWLSAGGAFHPMLVNLSVQSTPQVITFAKAKERRFAGGTSRSRIILSPMSDGWRVATWERLS